MSKKISKALYYLIILAIVLLSILTFRLIKIYDIFCLILNIVIPIFFGYALAWMLNPLYKRLSKKVGKKISFLIILLSLVLVYAGLIIILIPMIINESGNFIDLINSYIPKLKEIPFVKIDESNLSFDINTILESCGGIVSIVVNFALINMFGFYILYNYELINPFFKKLTPIRYRSLLSKFTKKISTSMYEFVKGTLLDALIMFLMTFILFSIFKFKYSVLLAVFIALTNIIPFIGPYVGGAPAVLIGFASGLNTGIIALSIVVICQLIESNLINPLIMSKVTKINPLVLVIAITIIGRFFGIIGMALSVPILIFIKITFEFYQKYRDKITAI